MPRTAANAFDAIAKPATAAKAKTSKVAATVTDAVRTAVDRVISLKAEEARIEAERKQAEEVIRAHVGPQQDELGFAGNFAGTLTVAGNQGEVLYVASDRFVVPKEPEAQDDLKRIMGEKFDSAFEMRRTITLKKEAMENAPLINKIVAALDKAGFTLADAFEVTDSLAAKSGLLENQYRLLTRAKLAEMRTIVRPYSPAVKPVGTGSAAR